MQLKFQRKYKSIPAGGELTLPKLVILTGLNGAGKSHFLQAIHHNHIVVTDDDGAVGKSKHINSIELIPQTSPVSTYQAAEQVYNLLIQWCDKLIIDGQSISNEGQYISRVPPNVKNPQQLGLFPAVKRLLELSFREGKRPINRFDVRKVVTSSELERYDNVDLFTQKFSTIFLRYYQDFELNEFARFKSIEGDKDYEPLTRDQFLAKHGPPPWELINKLIKRMELPYQIERPKSSSSSFKAQLTHLQNGETIDFMDLSSGEQTLCSIAIGLYQLDKGSSAFPNLLLLDEPDAHLHPKMVHSLLSILNTEILPQLSCGLIITTHSPSTCVLAPESSIFKMQRDVGRPTSCPTDEALDVLSVGVPTLSIRRENDKQILVESDADANLYQGLWSTLKRVDPRFTCGINLNFVSSKSGWRTGSCEHAKRLCDSFRNAGSTSTYALIDHDNLNRSESPIFVIGNGERYAIENYIHSPIAISSLLIHYLGRGDSSLPDYLIDFDKNSIGGVSEEGLMVINDEFCNTLVSFAEKAFRDKDLENKIANIDFSNNCKSSVSDFGGRTTSLPAWYLRSNGHDLEEAIARCFPRLTKYIDRKKAGELMYEVQKHVLDSNPDIIPKAVVDTFFEILSD